MFQKIFKIINVLSSNKLDIETNSLALYHELSNSIDWSIFKENSSEIVHGENINIMLNATLKTDYSLDVAKSSLIETWTGLHGVGNTTTTLIDINESQEGIMMSLVACSSVFFYTACIYVETNLEA